MITQEQINYVVKVSSEQLDDIDRALLNITTIFEHEGDELLDFTIKVVLEAKEKAKYLLHTLERFLERAKLSPNLNISGLLRGIKTTERFIYGIDGFNLSVPLE